MKEITVEYPDMPAAGFSIETYLPMTLVSKAARRKARRKDVSL